MPPDNMQLFDRALLRRRRRLAAAGLAAHDFLLARTAEDIAARLDAVKRDFPLALDLGANGGRLGRTLVAHPRVAAVVSTESVEQLLGDGAGSRVICDEEQLPFAVAAFDLAVSGLGLHLVNDLPGALIQIRRSLKPDGLFLGAVLGGGTLHELRDVMTAAEIETTGGASPHVAPFADVRDFGALLQRAGFALPVADADNVTVTYANIVALMHDLRGMGAANVLNERSRRPMRRALLARAGEIYAERFPAGGGRIAATFEIIHLSGWAPHESQQKPLAPGSARTRLADALGAAEFSAGEKTSPRKTGR